MIPDQKQLRKLSDEAAAHVLSMEGTRSGTRTGWLMISTILIEAWDLYSISFLLIFLKDEFKPSAALLGLASASVQLGALIGAMIGGWAADRLGRRKVFLTTMASFVVLAIVQAFATSMWELVIIRFLLGIPLGSDIATDYTYIMESMPKGKREVMGNRWQGMFGLGEVACIIVVTIMYLSGMDHGLLWRIGLALGAVPALILLIMRLDVPETALSLIQAGKFKQAKKVAKDMFNDPLDMLPDENYPIPRLPCRHLEGSGPQAGQHLRLDLQCDAGYRVLRIRVLPAGHLAAQRRLRHRRHQLLHRRDLHHRHDQWIRRPGHHTQAGPSRDLPMGLRRVLPLATRRGAVPRPGLEALGTGGCSCPDVVPLLVRLERDDHLFDGRALPV